MERLLVYLAVAAAVFLALTVAKLTRQPDYCSEARRLASAALAVHQSGGWVSDAFLLDEELKVNGSGIFHKGCGVSAGISTLNDTIIIGRKRLIILNVNGRPILLKIP